MSGGKRPTTPHGGVGLFLCLIYRSSGHPKSVRLRLCLHSCFRCATLAHMQTITLKEWAKNVGISRRKAEYLAAQKLIPVTKERRSYKVDRWQQVIREDVAPPFGLKQRPPKKLGRKPINRKCSLRGCKGKHLAFGYCLKHYRQLPEPKRKEDSRKAVALAIKSGELKRMPCIACGDPYTEAHHRDYSPENWLNVEWLCKYHHSEKHHKT